MDETTEPALEYVDGPPWMGTGDSDSPAWAADSEDPAERMGREERAAYEALKGADEANRREPWEPFLSEFELAVIERLLLVTATAQIYGQTGETEWALMGSQHLAQVQVMTGGHTGLVDFLAQLGPRLSLLQVRMASGESKGLFEAPF